MLHIADCLFTEVKERRMEYQYTKTRLKLDPSKLLVHTSLDKSFTIAVVNLSVS